MPALGGKWTDIAGRSRSRAPARERFAAFVVTGSEHRVVVRRRLRDRLDDIPVLDHLAVFAPVDVNNSFAARTVRQAMPMAVEDDESPSAKTRLISPCA